MNESYLFITCIFFAVKRISHSNTFSFTDIDSTGRNTNFSELGAEC